MYVIPVDGGSPRQLTFHNDVGNIPPRGGFDNQVLGWTPDGKQVLFNAHRTPYSERNARPYLIPAAGGMESPLPLREGSAGVLSPDGDRYVFAPVMDEFRGWKRYRGGRAADLWIYDIKKNSAEQITDNPANDFMPVWIGDTIYFVSERDKVGSTYVNNLFAYDTKTKAVRRVTNHGDFDVFWPSSADRKRIVYEDGGWIYLFDPASGKSNRVEIRVEGDLPRTLPYFKNVTEDVDAMGLSPAGKRALFTARGEVFSVPAEKGEIRNLTQTPGVREVAATWSPDGRWIAYLSDRTGEYEVWVRPADGSGEERRVTTNGDVCRFPLSWSPDSKKLAFGDTNRRLRWVDVATGKVTDADRSVRQRPSRTTSGRRTAATSPTPRWGRTRSPSIWIYALDDGKARQLTSDLTADGEPTWDPQGHYLYFLSNRDYNLTFSGYEFDYVYTSPTRVYVGDPLQGGAGPAPPRERRGGRQGRQGRGEARRQRSQGSRPRPPSRKRPTRRRARSPTRPLRSPACGSRSTSTASSSGCAPSRAPRATTRGSRPAPTPSSTCAPSIPPGPARSRSRCSASRSARRRTSSTPWAATSSRPTARRSSTASAGRPSASSTPGRGRSRATASSTSRS